MDLALAVFIRGAVLGAGTEVAIMDVPGDLLFLGNARLEERNGEYVVRIPDREVARGDLRPGGTYRVAVFSAGDQRPAEEGTTGRDADLPDPPVSEGETREVEIEDIGQQGDGIARVERGYVIIVPETDTGERVTVEITDVRENLAFARVIDRHDDF